MGRYDFLGAYVSDVRGELPGPEHLARIQEEARAVVAAALGA